MALPSRRKTKPRNVPFSTLCHAPASSCARWIERLKPAVDRITAPPVGRRATSPRWPIPTCGTSTGARPRAPSRSASSAGSSRAAAGGRRDRAVPVVARATSRSRRSRRSTRIRSRSSRCTCVAYEYGRLFFPGSADAVGGDAAVVLGLRRLPPGDVRVDEAARQAARARPRAARDHARRGRVLSPCASPGAGTRSRRGGAARDAAPTAA